MRIAYADPPYIGQARKHYAKHPDYAGEVDHAELVGRLVTEFDGWALSLSCKSLKYILSLCPEDVRVLSWVKPMTPILPGIRVQYGWEPVIVRGGRQGPHVTGDPMTRDWLAASPVGGTFRPLGPNHVIGRKPPEFCFWLFSVMGMRRGDTLVDLFPGTGAVGKGVARVAGRVDGRMTEPRTEADRAWLEAYEAITMLRAIVGARDMAWLDDEIEKAKVWLALRRPTTPSKKVAP